MVVRGERTTGGMGGVRRGYNGGGDTQGVGGWRGESKAAKSG